MQKFTRLAIDSPDALVYGEAPKPLKLANGMVLGGGTVYPELNFTLPSMTVNADTFPRVRKHYEEIVSGALKRAAELGVDGVQLEFETVPEMTSKPDWAIELTKVLLDGMATADDKYGLKSALRLTPNDNREMERPPLMRSGPHWEAMLETFDRGCAEGAHLLSIESVGGKEVHDEALTMCDIRQVIFALCIMGARDMEFLWDHMVEIATRHGAHPAGDTACGFGNTAMVLAEQNLIPHVFAALVRPVTAVRSLVAYERGAVGPGKDCGYENPILKAITGYPMAMEGKAAAVAHLSPLGNIAAATCDLWSNESIQNIKLLGGMAPTCCLEQLVYDCRLMNRATADGEQGRLTLRDWLVDTDAGLDPQAFILTPDNTIAFARTIVEADTPYQAGRQVAAKAVEILRQGMKDGHVNLSDREAPFLDMTESALDTMPDDEEAFIAQMMAEVEQEKFVAADYGLPS